MSWNGLVYYGESVGFVCAWIAGATALIFSAAAPAPQVPIDQVAVAAADTPAAGVSPSRGASANPTR